MSTIDRQAETIEASLTREQRMRAFDLAMQNGWFPGSRPPTAFWIQWFRQAQRELPKGDATRQSGVRAAMDRAARLLNEST